MNMPGDISYQQIPAAAGPVVRLTGQGGRFGSGLSFNEVLIHDPDDPVAEAYHWVEASLAQRVGRQDLPAAVAMVFGAGLGYHLKVLRQLYPQIRLLVFEPSYELEIIFGRHSMLDDSDGPAPEIYRDWNEYENAVSRLVVYGRESGTMVLAPEGYKKLWPEAWARFDSCARQQIMRRAVIEQTRANTDGLFLRNLAQNVGRLMNLPDLMILKGHLPARPALAVGAGPSLDDSLEALRAIGQRAFILAASSAVKPLLAAGVRPDVTVVLESSDTSDYLRLTEAEKAFLGPNCILALASGCHPAHFELDGFVQGIFHLSPGEAQLLSQGAFLPQGGNAGSAAFALAFCWGLGPLILVAQDQAYAPGKLHASGTPGEVQAPEGDLCVQGVGGGRVRTHSGLLASVGWFAEAAKTIAAQPNAPILFNASASGASIAGFNEVPLSVLAESLPAAVPLPVAQALPRLPRPNVKEVKKDVGQIASVVATLHRLAKTDYRRAAAEARQAAQISRFLGQVLAEAVVAASRSELKEALERAEALMSLMLSRLSSRH